jgi:predicted NAD/FAD-dependent oxidoreductase
MVVVGAGLSGLVAARELTASGHDVVVLDKGRGVGGRLATRRIGAARLDHGAQFFTARSDDFAAMTQRWIAANIVFEWCRGFTAAGDGYPRYAVHDGMTALAKHLARDLDVRCDTMVFMVRRTAHGWHVVLDDGTVISADGVVVTCPLPQAFSLLVEADVDLPEVLWRTEYDRTIVLLAVLDRPSAVPAPGGVQHVAGTASSPGYTFIGDNQAKGVSSVPALTMHTDPVWSDAHWDDDGASVLATLRTAAAPWLGDATIVESQVKRWRFATPRTIWPDACWQAPDAPSLIVAGDAFAGPRIEGAALSGLAAARAVLG